MRTAGSPPLPGGEPQAQSEPNAAYVRWLLMTEPSQTLGFKTLPGLARAFRRWAGESTVRRPPEVTGATRECRRDVDPQRVVQDEA
jgi:hypothetical protein